MTQPTFEATPGPVQVLVVYYSRFGALKVMAECVAEGARRVEDIRVELLEVEDRPIEELRPGERPQDMAYRRAAVLNQLIAADALIVGAPSYFGGMASPVKRLFEDCATATPPPGDHSRPWRHHLFHGKVGAAFTASGTPHGGNEQTLHSILTMMMHLGMVPITPGLREPALVDEAAPYGATAISGADGRRLPSDAERESARRLGQQAAEVAIWLRLGRAEWHRRRGGKHKPAEGTGVPDALV
jgi:NAD(P)H dehydrogenase (quinone)